MRHGERGDVGAAACNRCRHRGTGVQADDFDVEPLVGEIVRAQGHIEWIPVQQRRWRGGDHELLRLGSLRPCRGGGQRHERGCKETSQTPHVSSQYLFISRPFRQARTKQPWSSMMGWIAK